MTLERLVFDLGGGVTVELKPELLIRDQSFHSSLGYVPAAVKHNNGKRKNGHLKYNWNENSFCSPLTDIVATAACDPEQINEMGRLYGVLLWKGADDWRGPHSWLKGIMVKEQCHDPKSDKWQDVHVYDNFYEFYRKLE